MPPCVSGIIVAHDRIIPAIGKHVAADCITGVCAGIGIRIDKSPVCGIIITRLQIIESRLIIIIISAISEGIDFSQSTGAGHDISPCIILVSRNRLILKAGDVVDQLYHVALQIQNVIICLEARSIRRVLECKRLSGFIIDEIQYGCQAIICLNRLSGYFAVQGQIFMGNGLFAGNMGPLRGDGFIFSRNIRLDRFALAAGHDLTGTGRLRRDSHITL